MSKSWFNWRTLRRPKGAVLRQPEIPAEFDRKSPRLRAAPKKLFQWPRFGRKPSPFDLRPGAIEGWMKGLPSKSSAAKPRPVPGRWGRTDGDV
ncbi:hypothetical protein ABAC460_14275 [Asticcacaulis sp. AC460]|uniref:hypothetical protein n=1 Tax=Asticcacaulis sp. AC460 TaxID=1282360 RepID=UPI0003C3B294|nr:hypothetical protein [Asticcacaulis sp. AC460]ESQ88944.1 hypothetical protein ABAC460_14275 [Asticcacaulis sp. AC460]